MDQPHQITLHHHTHFGMDLPALLAKLEESKDKPSFKGLLCRTLNILLDKEDRETLDQVCSQYIIEWKSDASLAILGIRYHLLYEELEKAKALLLTVDGTRKRHFSLVMEKTKDFDLFFKMVQRGFEMNGNDVAIFWDTPHLGKVLMLLHDTYITLPKEVVGTTFDPPKAPSGHILEKLYFPDTKRYRMMESIKTPTPKRDRGPKPTVIIDGANVLFYGHREVDDQSFVRLTNVYNTLVDEGFVPQIVLHKHHLTRQGYKIDKRVRDAIVFPKKGSHDDLYFIGLALTHYPCHVLSNDLLRDHVVKNPDIKTWITEYGIRYECAREDTVVNLTIPQKWSNIVHRYYNHYYVHREDGKWLDINDSSF